MNRKLLLALPLAIGAGTLSTAASAATVIVTNSGASPSSIPLILVPLGGGTFTSGSTDTLTSSGNGTRNFTLTYTFAAPTNGEGSISFTTTSVPVRTNSALITLTSASFNGSPVTLTSSLGANLAPTYSGNFGFSNALAGDPFSLVVKGTVRHGGTLSTSLAFTSAVPEPAAWVMMIGGFGLVGGAMRRRNANVRTKVSFA